MAVSCEAMLKQQVFCPSKYGTHFWCLSTAGTEEYKTWGSVPSTLFFDKLHHRRRLCSYIKNYRDIREPSMVRLNPNGLFFCTGEHGTHFGCSNQCLNTCKKQGIMGPLFSFSIEYIVSISYIHIYVISAVSASHILGGYAEVARISSQQAWVPIMQLGSAGWDGDIENWA